jgi:hypothetical protein
MTKLTAIVGSVAKWHRIRYEGCIDKGVINCPLCQTYYNRTLNNKCYRCPIFKLTRRNLCWGTPYDSWYYAGTKEDKKLALAELNFLYDLIPPQQRSNALRHVRAGKYSKRFKLWFERRVTG